MTAPHPDPARYEIDVDGEPASYLTAGDGPVVVLLHGTYWSRVWAPVVGMLSARGLRPVAIDLPGSGRSGGELDLVTGTVPELASWVGRFVDALGPSELAGVAGHDIGGAVAQHLAVAGPFEVDRLALVNSVSYDSWPVPGVARYRDPDVVAATTAEEIVAARREAVTAALLHSATPELVEEYLEPWHDPRVARSWMALAGAADSRYTLDLLDDLRSRSGPTLLVWGEQDTFQPLRYAERLAAELPSTTLTVVPGAGHVPMEDDPAVVARALGDFFTGADGD